MTINHYGILGGSFDPAHYGHLYNAINCIENTDVERVFLNPTNNPPHKETNTDIVHRNHMANVLANCDKSNDNIIFRPTDYIHNLSRSYNTLEVERGALEENFNIENLKLYFLIGSDMVKNFHEWYRYGDILNDYNVIVIKRPGYEIDGKSEVINNLHTVVEQPSKNVSSTEIRQNVDQYKDMMPDEVYDYIKRNEFYER